MADNTRLVINDLSDFGKKIGGMGLSSGSSDSSTMSSLSKDLGTHLGEITKGNVAGSGLRTSTSLSFNDWITKGVSDPTTQAFQDLPKRVMALSGGAVVMAANYADGDASQATAMARAHASSEVFDMFTQDPSKGLDHDLDSQQNAEKQHTKVVPLPPPDKEPIVKEGQQPPQTPYQKALQQEKENQDKYGKDETWTPAPPPKQPKTVILAPGPFDGQPPSGGTTV
jgi:hypothetical protein